MQNIKFKKIEIVLLLLIALLGSFLYLHKLGDNPPGLYLDEVGTGYNTFSILKTGKDEYGKFLPVAFRLFGSYTPPLYVYFSVPIMTIFGLSAFSTRLLSAISGITAIFVIYFIIKELKITSSKLTPIIGTLFFAITPWTIFFSRMGYEQNLAFLFFSISVLLILKTSKNLKLLLITVPFISVATYTDYPQRLIAPLLLIGSAIIFRKIIFKFKNKKIILLSIALAFVIELPNLFLITTPSFYTKGGHFYSDVVNAQSKKIEHYLPRVVAYPLSLSREFLSQYFTYFSPRSLFFLPDEDPQRSMPNLSVFYPWMIVPYAIGGYLLIRSKNSYSKKFIILLLLITPLPGALTKQPFHIQRTLTLLLPLTLILTIGYDKLISLSKNRIIIPTVFGLLSLSLLLFWRSYFVLLPQQRSDTWGFEWKQISQYISDHPNDHFVIDQSNRIKPQEMAYPQLAFYLKLDPLLIQSDQKKDIKNYYTDIEFSTFHKFLNIETKAIDWGEAANTNEILIGDTVSISDREVKLHNLKEVIEIKDPLNNIVLRGFRTSPNIIKNSK